PLHPPAHDLLRGPRGEHPHDLPLDDLGGQAARAGRAARLRVLVHGPAAQPDPVLELPPMGLPDHLHRLRAAGALDVLVRAGALAGAAPAGPGQPARGGGRGLTPLQAFLRMSLMTLPPLMVGRSSRPLWSSVRRLWSSPRQCRMVAWT